jgi:uncharacterized iron-regulated protein
MSRTAQSSLLACLSALPMLPFAAQGGQDAQRPNRWIDLSLGEPLPYDAVLHDLAQARVIHLGARHTLQRHHDLRAKSVTDLAAKGVKFVLGLEQLETFQQPLVEHYNFRQFDFDTLAKATRVRQSPPPRCR